MRWIIIHENRHWLGVCISISIAGIIGHVSLLVGVILEDISRSDWRHLLRRKMS